jgi:gluconokinase
MMGVAGCGKTTVGLALATRLRWQFLEGDDLHSAANIAKMSAGVPLDDADRLPWLAAIVATLREQPDTPTVLSCSALKVTYRDLLRRAGNIRFVHLRVGEDTLRRRMSTREGHYMRTDMLASQLADLEPLGPEEAGATVDAERSGDQVVRESLRWVRRWWQVSAQRRNGAEA